MSEAGGERLPQSLGEWLRQAAHRDGAEHLAVVELQTAASGAAEAVRLFEDRVEHRREIAGRAVDDLQDLGGRGLLLQRLARLGDQPRVLDRDDRLVGEGANQLDLRVR